MSDITERLRAAVPTYEGTPIAWPCEVRSELLLEAVAEVERQARHIEELQEKIDAEKSCACSFDAPGDVCAAHSPALMQARAEVERLREALKIAAVYVNGCYHAWHLTRDRAEAWRDLTKIREALNDERAGEL